MNMSVSLLRYIC